MNESIFTETISRTAQAGPSFNEAVFPATVGIFIGIIIVFIFTNLIQKVYYKKINERSVKNIKVLLKEFDEMKNKLERKKTGGKMEKDMNELGKKLYGSITQSFKSSLEEFEQKMDDKFNELNDALNDVVDSVNLAFENDDEENSTEEEPEEEKEPKENEKGDEYWQDEPDDEVEDYKGNRLAKTEEEKEADKKKNQKKKGMGLFKKKEVKK